MPFSVRSRISSFRHAFRGLATLLRTQHNAWIHLAATVAVIVVGVVLGIGRTDWLAVVVAVGLVWTAEALNTAVEFLADEVSLDRRELIGQAKDVAAAGVLVASISASHKRSRSNRTGRQTRHRETMLKSSCAET